MSAKSYQIKRETDCHQRNIELLKQRSLQDALDYALDAAAHYENRDGEVAGQFLAEAHAIERELHPEAFTPVIVPAATLPAPKSELLWTWAF